MLLGRTLIKSATPYYCPGFLRAGTTVAVTVAVLVIEAGGSATFDVDIEHKNLGDTTWSTATSFTQLVTESTQTKVLSSPKEMLRLKYTVGGSAASDFVHFQVYDPVWMP